MALKKTTWLRQESLARRAMARPGPPVREPVHLIFAVADHFEPAIVPEDGQKRVPRPEQERRLESWVREYPKAVDPWRDHDGRPFAHTYFYPAEQYDEGLLEMIAEHCHAGWGEAEIHLHHGIPDPDTPENTRRCSPSSATCWHFAIAAWPSKKVPTRRAIAFVHGNFALANSADGRFCGVDSEMQILAETGCYADLTLPTAPMHPAQTAKINSLYECACRSTSPRRTDRDLI